MIVAALQELEVNCHHRASICLEQQPSVAFNNGTGRGEEKYTFEVLVRAQQFLVECGFKRFGLAHGAIWLGAHIGFE